MSHYYACVWIDHREAKVFGIGSGEVHGDTIMSDGPDKHLHRKADHVDQGKLPPDKGFMDEVSEALAAFKALLITGPGQAKAELLSHLRHHYPETASKVWGIEAMDHPSDRQLIASARRYFHAERRMHD